MRTWCPRVSSALATAKHRLIFVTDVAVSHRIATKPVSPAVLTLSVEESEVSEDRCLPADKALATVGLTGMALGACLAYKASVADKSPRCVQLAVFSFTLKQAPMRSA